MVALHEGLGIVLAALKHRSLAAGPDDGDGGQMGVGLEIVVDALHQRVFGSYYHHVHLVLQHKVPDGVKIIGLDGDIGTHLCGARVSGGDIQLACLGALGNLPGQGVLAAAASQK